MYMEQHLCDSTNRPEGIRPMLKSGTSGPEGNMRPYSMYSKAWRTPVGQQRRSRPLRIASSGIHIPIIVSNGRRIQLLYRGRRCSEERLLPPRLVNRAVLVVKPRSRLVPVEATEELGLDNWNKKYSWTWEQSLTILLHTKRGQSH
jgi:hypothetical protein